MTDLHRLTRDGPDHSRSNSATRWPGSLPAVMSPRAAAIRAGIVRASVDPSVSVLDERQAWEAAAAATPLPEWAGEELVAIGGVPCRTVRANDVSDDAATVVYRRDRRHWSGEPATLLRSEALGSLSERPAVLCAGPLP